MAVQVPGGAPGVLDTVTTTPISTQGTSMSTAPAAAARLAGRRMMAALAGAVATTLALAGCAADTADNVPNAISSQGCADLVAAYDDWAADGANSADNLAATASDDEFVVTITRVMREEGRTDSAALGVFALQMAELQAARADGRLEARQIDEAQSVFGDITRDC